MTLPVTFRRAARAEFIEAAAWYEAQRPNLGVEFVAEVERCVAVAAEQPQLYAVVHKGMRRVTCGAVSIQRLLPCGDAARCYSGSLSRQP